LHKEAILNYLILHKIHRDASKLDSEMRRLMPDIPFQTRSNLCVEKVLDNLNLVSGRFYSMFAINGESDRLKLGEMAESIKESLGNRIKQADWLDNSTRASAIKKVNVTNKII
jgi:predicted metalloendopeptidase